MRFDELINQVERGVIKPFYLLTGPETFLIEAVADKIISQVFGKAKRKSSNLVTVSGEGVSGGSLRQTAMTVPMFGGQRIIRIKKCQSIKDQDKLLGYVSKPSPQTVLIFSDEKVDLRTRFWKNLSKAPESIVFKAYPLFDNQLPGWVRNRARSIGCQIDSEAAELLIGLVGGDLSALAGELDKLSLALKDSRRISAGEVDELVADTRKYNVFELLDTIGRRNLVKSTKILQSLMAEGEHPLKILSMLARQLRIIWQGKQMEKEGYSLTVIFKKLRIMRRNEQSFSKQISFFSEKRLKKVFFLCRQVDLKLKSTAIPPEYLMNDLLVQIINPNNSGIIK